MVVRIRQLAVLCLLLPLLPQVALGQSYVEQEDGSSSYIDCSDGTVVYDDEFALWMGELLGGTRLDSALFVFTQCHSGGMLDELATELPGNTPVALLSAAAWDEYAWLCPSDAPAEELRACGVKTRGVSFYVDALVSILNRTPAADLTMSSLADSLPATDEAAPGGAATDPRIVPAAYWVDTPEHPQSLFLGPGEAIRIGYSLRGDVLSTDDRWALLFVGDADEQWTLNDLDLFYNTLLDLGYSADNIIVLAGSQEESADFADDPLLDPFTHTTSEAASGLPSYVDGYATRAVLVDSLLNLGESMDAGAQFLFWTTGHGATTATLAWDDAPVLDRDILAYGTLEAGDAVLPDDTYADLYRFMGNEGETVEITLASAAFDAYVWVYDKDRQIIASGDDELNYTDCQIRVDLTYAGPYYVLVNSYGPGYNEYGYADTNYVSETGMYTLALGEPTSAAETPETELTVSTVPATGVLESGDGTDATRAYYDAYTVDLWADSLYSMSLLSDSFDAFFTLYDAHGELLASADDTGNLGTDARIWFVPIDGGFYDLLVSSFHPDSTGPYTVSVQSGFAGMPYEVAELTSGSSITGTLQSTDEVWLDEYVSGCYGDAYRLTVPTSQTVYIALRSDAFDSYLYALDAYGTLIGVDDESGGGGDALLEFYAYAGSTYIVVATSFWSYEIGDYTLAVGDEPPASDLPTPIGEVRLGDTVSGTLDADDVTLEDGTPCESRSFEGQGGTAVEIEMQSYDLDAFLYLYNNSGEWLAYDDDSAGDMNARIVAYLPYDGTYYVVANAYSSYEYGDYTLSIAAADVAGSAISSRALPDLANTTPLADSHTARLETDDYVWESSSYCDVYTFSAGAGIEITIDMTSGSLDSMLYLLDEAGSTLAENDDASYSTYDSRLAYTFVDSGTYYLVATTWSTYETGPYALTVVRKE